MVTVDAALPSGRDRQNDGGSSLANAARSPRNRKENEPPRNDDGGPSGNNANNNSRNTTGPAATAKQRNQQQKNTNNTTSSQANHHPAHLPVKHEYRINQSVQPDAKLGDATKEDPRQDDPTKRITKFSQKRGNGRNTESFDPASTLVRPDLRVRVASPRKKSYGKPLKHDDVVIVPELFGDEENWDLYYKLVHEIRDLSKTNDKAKWVSWHEGAHLISNDPKGSPTFEMVIDRLCEYFDITKKSVGTRFNWYKDSNDWKPFHHDSAAFNPHRAKTQNITVGVSFGACRELAFIRAQPQENGEKVKVYFPQPNNGVFSFGRDVNILWKHGINALAEEEQDGRGRVSIILWGLAGNVVEEEGSPHLLGSDGKGPHGKGYHNGKGGRKHGKNNNGRNNGNDKNNHRGGRGQKQQNNQSNKKEKQ